MVFVGDRKFACSTCIKGHRSSTCAHTDRPLFAIRAKGRPVSQCEHCRELRKTKQVHVKCECDSRLGPGSAQSGASASSVVETAGGAQLITARKGARKIKTLESATATFPNGIQDMVEAAALLSTMSDGGAAETSQYTCKQTGVCDCCTDRYEKKPKAHRGSKTHSNRPSISLTIPDTSDYAPSTPSHSPGRSIVPLHPSPSRSHSRSPSRQHHAIDGHQIGGDQSNHLSSHVALYSPYSADHSHYLHANGQDALRSPTSSGSNSQDQSPNGNPLFSPVASTAPTSTGSLLLAPSYSPYGDGSAPPSPLDRPRSALSIQTSVGTGRNTPVDYSGSPSHSGQISDWNAAAVSALSFGVNSTGSLGDGMQSMSLAQHSPVIASPIEQFLGPSQQQSQQQLSPVSAFSSSTVMAYRQQQEAVSPISPSTSHFLSPVESSGQPSPTYGNLQYDLQQSFDPNPMGLQSHQIQNGFGNINVNGQGLGDVFDPDDDDQSPLGHAAAALMEVNRSRRGSHQSVSSNHSGMGQQQLAPEIRLLSASPIPPHPHSPAQPATSELGNSGPTRVCMNEGQGCHCWSPDGPQSESERCQGPGCACCSYLGAGLSHLNLDLDLLGGGGSPLSRGGGASNKFAMSTERQAGYATPIMGNGGGGGNNNNMVDYSLQIPPYVSRSRSSSSSSHGSAHSQISIPSLLSGGIGTPNTGASLGRANSTGQIGRNGGNKYKQILPRPTHPTTSDQMAASQGQKSYSHPSSNAASGPSSPAGMFQYNQQQQQQHHDPTNLGFQFPRHSSASVTDLRSAAPAVIVTQPAPSESFTQFMRSPLLENSAQDSFGTPSLPGSPSEPYPSLFDGISSSNGGGSNPNQPTIQSHSRNHSTPSTTFQAYVTNRASPSSPTQHQQQQNHPQQQQQHTGGNQSHGRSQSYANASAGFLQEPRPQLYGHGRSSSTSLLDTLRNPIEFVITPASPYGAGSTG